jgi:hypothetical protein
MRVWKYKHLLGIVDGSWVWGLIPFFLFLFSVRRFHDNEHSLFLLDLSLIDLLPSMLGSDSMESDLIWLLILILSFSVRPRRGCIILSLSASLLSRGRRLKGFI